MEYQKLKLLDNATNQPSKFKIRKWIEINDESWGTYNVSNQIEFKTSMIRSNLCDYSDVYMLVNGTITFTEQEQTMLQNKQTKKIKKQYLKIVPHLLTAWLK